MIDLRAARSAAGRIRARWLLAAIAPLMAAAVGVAAPASAAAGGHAGSAAAARPAAVRPATVAGVNLRTLVPHVPVHSRAMTKSRIVGVIKTRGARVTVACYVRGVPTAGNPIWYLLSWPVAGYVTAFYLNSHSDPAFGIGRCGAKPHFSRVYHTLVGHLPVRVGPWSYLRAVGYLGGFGSAVRINCYAYGQRVDRDAVWYHASWPHPGWVAGFYLDTGRDPAPGVPVC
jgi:hypothetical protein